ncbi:site-specific DNA-methyltransferase [Sulfobacillus sp. hq2]|uniref:site-specific DNA-methyltransferase n=1 Tax=Sulfobacillus TaxID=28033 RepID=UPI001A9A6ACD|nr:site-specific DNA-methyltransferase [Sulfobacillus sp. hq2]
MNKPDRLPMHTPSITDENFAKLAQLFPNAVTETIDENGAVVRAVDADVLAQEINVHVVSGKEERYQFTWPDKRKSILLANQPIAATLRPCREESVDFDTTENLYIEGDNLDVLKLLRETYLNRVKMIYIDPPYNTGNDFIYEDNFSEESGDFLRRDGQYDEQGNRLTPNLDSNGRFHSDWLNMMYPRLRVARDLLSGDGVIFISIDDSEGYNLRKLCDEVFGENNFVGTILWKKKTNGNNMGMIPPVHDYIIAYAKHVDDIGEIGYEITEEFIAKTYSNPDNDPRGAWTTMDLSANHKGPHFPITNPSTGQTFNPPEGRYWVFNEVEVQRRIADGRIIFGKTGTTRPVQKIFAAERLNGKIRAESWWDSHGMNADATEEIRALFGQGKLFTHPKPSKLIYNLLKIATGKDDLVLDFFSGSATTAHAVLQLNAEDGGKRKFIMVQIPEACNDKSEAFRAGYKNICEIGKERIRRAGRKIKEEAGPTALNLDIGFRVLKLDSSNMKDVYYRPEEIMQIKVNPDGLIDNIKPDRTDEDLLLQAMLDLGIPLSAKITQDGPLFYVNDTYLIACFGRVDTALITDIAKKHPYYAVFRDATFVSDSAMVNIEQVFATYSPSTIRRVL